MILLPFFAAFVVLQFVLVFKVVEHIGAVILCNYYYSLYVCNIKKKRSFFFARLKHFFPHLAAGLSFLQVSLNAFTMFIALIWKLNIWILWVFSELIFKCKIIFIIKWKYRISGYLFFFIFTLHYIVTKPGGLYTFRWHCVILWTFIYKI